MMKDITGFVPSDKQAKWIDYMLKGYGLSAAVGEYTKSELAEMEELVELELAFIGKNHSGDKAGMYHLPEEHKSRAANCVLWKELNVAHGSETTSHHIDLIDPETNEPTKVKIQIRDKQAFGRYAAVYFKPNNKKGESYACGTSGKNLEEALYNIKKQLINSGYFKKLES